MKKLFISYCLFFLFVHGIVNAQSNSEWAATSIDTIQCVFKVSSAHYEHALIIAKKGFVVRVTISYTGDRMPCEDCDYDDKHKTVAYLNARKKPFDEKQYHVWEVEVIQ